MAETLNQNGNGSRNFFRIGMVKIKPIIFTKTDGLGSHYFLLKKKFVLQIKSLLITDRNMLIGARPTKRRAEEECVETQQY